MFTGEWPKGRSSGKILSSAAELATEQATPAPMSVAHGADSKQLERKARIGLYGGWAILYMEGSITRCQFPVLGPHLQGRGNRGNRESRRLREGLTAGSESLEIR